MLQGRFAPCPLDPAHVVAAARARIGPGVREPAHFFDPNIRPAIEDLVLVSALDEVYPDIRLGERIASTRLAVNARAVSPHVTEPAHFRATDLLRDEEFVAELGQLIQRFMR